MRKRLTLTKSEAMEIMTEFLEMGEFRVMVQVFLGSQRDEYAFHPERHGLEAHPYHAVGVIGRMYDYAMTGVYRGGNADDDIGIIDGFTEITFPQFIRACSPSTVLNRLTPLFELICAREKVWPVLGYIYREVNLTRNELAMLADMSEETIRVATHAEGEQRLVVDKHGDIERSEARRWLTLKKIEFEGRYEVDLDPSPGGTFDKLESLNRYLKQRLEACKASSKDVLDALPELQRTNVNKLLFKDDEEELDNLFWLTPTVSIILARNLKLKASWLVEQIVDLAALRIKKNIVSQLEHEAQQIPVEKALSFNEESLATARSVREYLASLEGISRHKLQTKPNSKMDAYEILKQGITFTHEHSLRTQYIWCPKEKLNQEKLNGLSYRHYPSTDLNKNGVYGRHSGLRKYPEIAEADLIRVTINTLADLRQTLAALAEASE